MENTAKLCHLLENLQGNVLTVGDFNSLGIDWVRTFSNSVGEKVFIDVLSRKFGNQHINFPAPRSRSRHGQKSRLEARESRREKVCGKYWATRGVSSHQTSIYAEYPEGEDNGERE